MKIVINTDYSGFGLSRKAFLELRKLGHPLALKETDIGESWGHSKEIRTDCYDKFCYYICRTDPLLIQVIEKLGIEESNGGCAQLKIIEIPDGIEYEIHKYDGIEHIAEKHSTWH